MNLCVYVCVWAVIRCGYFQFIAGQAPSEETFLELKLPNQVAARSKAWVCGRSLARHVGSNPAEGMDVRLL